MNRNGCISINVQKTDAGLWAISGLYENEVLWTIEDSIRLYYAADGQETLRCAGIKGYDTVLEAENGLICKVRFETENGSCVEAEDRYICADKSVQIRRSMSVRKASLKDDGFCMDFELALPTEKQPGDLHWFSPGWWCGKGKPFFRLNDLDEAGEAIDSYGAPVILCYDEEEKKGISLTDASSGRCKTIASDREQSIPGNLISDEFFLSGMGTRKKGTGTSLFYSYPAYTYRNKLGTLYRLLPFKEGLMRKINLEIHAIRQSSYDDAIREVWYRAYREHAHIQYYADPIKVRQVLLQYIDDSYTEEDGVCKYMKCAEFNEASSGFLFRNIDLAHLMLEAWKEQGNDSWKEHAVKVIESQIEDNRMYGTGKLGYVELRPSIESLNSLVKCWAFMEENRMPKPHWLKKAVEEAEEIIPIKEYFSVSLMISLYRATGEERYLSAAIKKGGDIWESNFKYRYFTGGITDCEKGCIDRESAILALEGYLDIYETTGDKTWLDRAAFTGDYLETVQYIQDIDMIASGATGKDVERRFNHSVVQIAPDNKLSVRGLSHIGIGGACGDIYNVYSAPDFYRLYKHTGNEHYLHFASLLQYETVQYVDMGDKENGLTDILHGSGIGFTNEFFAIGIAGGYVTGRGWAHADNIGWCPYVLLSSMHRMNQIYGSYALPLIKEIN